MLDQNTDRMWYVIGAVIVGAALLFLMNGTFPGLFGSIGELFEDKVLDVSAVVEDVSSDSGGGMTDGVGPKTPNLLLNTDNNQAVVLIGAPNAATRAMKVDELDAGVTKYTILDQADESYYRFMPDRSTDRYGLESGDYVLSGYIYIPSTTKSSIELRSQYSTVGNNTFAWHSDYGNGAQSFDDIERDTWVFFSDTSTLPDFASGYYMSLSSRSSQHRVAGDVFYTKGLKYQHVE